MFLPLKKGEIRLTTVILMVHNQMTTATQLTLKELFFLRKKSLATKKAIPLHDFGCGVSIYGTYCKNFGLIWLKVNPRWVDSTPLCVLVLKEILPVVQRRIYMEKNFYY